MENTLVDSTSSTPFSLPSNFTEITNLHEYAYLCNENDEEIPPKHTPEFDRWMYIDKLLCDYENYNTRG
jgi:hypothetical protein